MSKDKLGFPPRKRHIFVDVLDAEGKPTGMYVCVTCEREEGRR